MGFGDKLKGLREQAQQAVAENKDKIQDAVQVVGDVANTKTNGRYANKIAKAGMKVEQGVDKFSEGAPLGADQPQSAEEQPKAAAEQPKAAADQPQAAETNSWAAPATEAPATPVRPSAGDEPASGFPEFE